MKFEATVIGTVGRDAEVRQVGDNKVCSFSVATADNKDQTIWVRVSTWGKRADIDGKYVKKGMKIFCRGPIRADENGYPRTYTDKSGNVKASNFEMTAFEIKYLSKSDRVSDTESITATFDSQEEIPF